MLTLGMPTQRHEKHCTGNWNSSVLVLSYAASKLADAMIVMHHLPLCMSHL